MCGLAAGACAGGTANRLSVMRRRVTYSRNLTLSLSRTCQCYCKYCAFATHTAHLYAPEEVLAIVDGAARRGVKELLVLTGERPEVNAEVARRLREYGHADFTAYVVWACERALERGILPHTNLGVLALEDLARLREVTASQGLMLESISERLMDTVHAGSPTKHPARRLATIRAAGELRIPFTSGILVGIGESEEERVASLEALAAVHAEHGHLQEVILQNFVPHQRYYGQEPAQIADTAAREYWRTGVGDDRPQLPLPEWACPVSIEDMKRLIAETRRLMPDVGIQVPPNLADWWPELVAAGATDLGGLSANGDHISPEHPFPSPHQVRKQLQRDGVALTERLCVYPRYIDPEWVAPAVMDTIKVKFWSFIPRRGSGRTDPAASGAPPIRPGLVGGAVERARDGLALTPEELTAMFAETRPEAIEGMREAADELRAELAGDTVTFVVNRNINVSNVCTVGCAFCGFGQGKRSPDAYQHDEREFARRVREAVAFGASELCIQSGIHPDWSSRTTSGGCASPSAPPPGREWTSTCMPTRRWRSRTCAISPRCPRRGVRAPARRRPRLHAGHRRGGAARRGARTDLAEQAAGRTVGGDHRSLARGRVALHGDGHVRAHRGAVGAGRAHARGARAAGAHGGNNRVRAALLYPLPDAARPYTRGRGDLARGEPQAHRRLPVGVGSQRAQCAGLVGEDGLGCRDGVAALGRQRPGGDADGGVDLPPRRLLPRHAPGARAACGGRARRGAPGGRAYDVV